MTGLKLPVRTPGVVPAGTERITVTGWLAPLTRLASVQLTVGVANVHVVAATLAPTKVSPAGTV